MNRSHPFHHPTPPIAAPSRGPRVLVVLAIAALLGAGHAASEQRDLDLRGVTRVDARTVSGHIHVLVDTASTGVTIDNRGNVSFDVRVEGDRLVVEGRPRSILCLNCEVSFEIRLAAPADLSLHTTNGNIMVLGAMRRVSASTTNGNVATRDTGDAPLELGSTNGRLLIERAHASVDARTNNGTVEVHGLDLPAGADAALRSVNGSVIVEGIRSDAALLVSGHLSNGGLNVDLTDFDVRFPDRRSFEARGTGRGNASLRLQTVNGSLSVRN